MNTQIEPKLDFLILEIWKVNRNSFKESACQCKRHKRQGFDPWVRKIPWRRILAWSPLQYFYLEDSMDRGAWWALVHEVTKS